MLVISLQDGEQWYWKEQLGTSLSLTTPTLVWSQGVRYAWGPVITDSAADHFAGATHGSNNTGELTAVVESFRWIIDRVEKEDKKISVGQV